MPPDLGPLDSMQSTQIHLKSSRIDEINEKNRILLENVNFLNNSSPKLIYSTRFLKINNCVFNGNKQIFINYAANRHIVTNSTFTSNNPDQDPDFGVASLFHTNNW